MSTIEESLSIGSQIKFGMTKYSVILNGVKDLRYEDSDPSPMAQDDKKALG